VQSRQAGRARKRAIGALPFCLLVAAVALAGCGGSGGSSTASKPPTDKPAGSTGPPRTIAVPAGLLTGTAPQPNGTLWVLAGGSSVRTITELNLSTGKQDLSVGVSDTAQALAQSSTGILALGLGSVRAGAVELLNASTGAVAGTIPVGAPVMSVAFGDDGVTLYVLDGTAKTRSVTVINTSTQRVTGTIGLPSDARSIAPTPDQQAIWSLQASGVVQETSLTSRKPIESFPTGNPGIAVAVAPSGGVLYVLKGTSASANIAVISLATESVKSVLAAAANSVDLGVSLDGSQLYDFVGAPSYGNIQILDL
jgi:DNA-binding beta-propeller fold protein YncE